MKIEFTLTMPGRGSWNGGWSGETRQHIIYREVTGKRCVELDLPKSWDYAFGDGWVARVSAQPASKVRVRRAAGFLGYDWMVDSILLHGEIRT